MTDVDAAIGLDPRKMNPARLRNAATSMVVLASWLERNAMLVAETANTVANDAISGVAYDRQRGAPGHSDPTALAGMRTQAPAVPAEVTELVRTLERSVAVIVKAQRFVTPRANAQKSAEQSTTEVGVGACANCGHVCAGMVLVNGRKVQDRLRAGRCDACRKFWGRNGTDRPRRLWAETEVDGEPTAAYWAGIEATS